MKLPINWQDWDLNVLLYDLNQYAASQLRLQEGYQGLDK
jgi:hypothetical protein